MFDSAGTIMNSPEPDLPFDPTTHPYRWFLLAGVWLMYFCFGVVIASIAPLVLEIETELGFSHSRMGAVLGAWQTIYIAAALPAGILLDRIGPRWALLLCVGLMTSSMILRAVAIDHTTLLLAVAVLGLGGPLVSIGSPKVISTWFVGSERGFAMGVYITGPLIGNMLTTSLIHSVFMPLLGGSWRLVMLALGGFILSTGIAWLLVTNHESVRAVERARAASPRESQVRVFLELLHVPAVRILLAMSIGIFLINHAFLGWLPEILRAGGMDQTAAGYWSSVPTGAAVVSALLIPRMATPPRRFTILLVLFLAAGASTMLIGYGNHLILPFALILQGTARGALMTVAILTLLDVPQIGSRRAALAGGMFFTSAEIGGVMGPVSVGVISDLTGGFTPAMIMVTAICGVLILLLWMLRRATEDSRRHA